MTRTSEPNPPARREEDFPKTTTIPDGWDTDALMDAYNAPRVVQQGDPGPQPDKTVFLPPVERANGRAHSDGDGDLFTRRLEPFESPGDQFGMWL